MNHKIVVHMFAVLGGLLPYGVLCAQTTAVPPAQPSVTVNLGNNVLAYPSSAGGKADLVGIQPGQAIPLVLQYPSSEVGHSIVIQPLDGVSVITASVKTVVASDGSLNLSFLAPQNPGLYRISLGDGSQKLLLQFYILDSLNPQNNPGCITAANPNY